MISFVIQDRYRRTNGYAGEGQEHDLRQIDTDNITSPPSWSRQSFGQTSTHISHETHLVSSKTGLLIGFLVFSFDLAGVGHLHRSGGAGLLAAAAGYALLGLQTDRVLELIEPFLDGTASRADGRTSS